MKKVFLFFGIVSFLITVGLMAYELHFHNKLEKKFEKQSKYTYHRVHYAEEIQNGELQLDLLAVDLPLLDRTIGIDYDQYVYYLAAPCTIFYYESIGDTEPVYTIQKGEVLYYTQMLYEGEVTFRGMESLPTEKAGWRMAKPFSVEGSEDIDQLYYVKLKDLLSVAEKWLRVNDLYSKYYPNNSPRVKNGRLQYEEIKRGLLPTMEYRRRTLTLEMDQYLLQGGFYLSPDLMYPVFSGITWISFSVTVSLLGIWTILKIRSKKKKE